MPPLPYGTHQLEPEGSCPHQRGISVVHCMYLPSPVSWTQPCDLPQPLQVPDFRPLAWGSRLSSGMKGSGGLSPLRHSCQKSLSRNTSFPARLLLYSLLFLHQGLLIPSQALTLESRLRWPLDAPSNNPRCHQVCSYKSAVPTMYASGEGTTVWNPALQQQ